MDKMVFIDVDGEFEDVVKHRDYSENPITPFGKTYSPITSSQSGYSLLQANGVYFDAGNTYIPDTLGGMSTPEHLEHTLNVLDRKASVWDKERTYIFKKLK